jgi:3-oxoacyl-[acyl-carrier protein] reductase
VSGSPLPLAGRVALVTGAGSAEGIGYACAQRLRRDGAAVAICSTTDRIAQRAEELEATPGPGAVLGLVADLTDEAQVGVLVDAVRETLGPVDVLVNNAGMGSVGQPEPFEPVVAMSAAGWRSGIERNLTTAFLVTRAVLPSMLEHAWGRLVTVASTTGALQANPGEAAYAAGKAGLVGLTRVLALETAPSGVTANVVAPGWIATAAQTPQEAAHGRAAPMRRSGTPAEVAAAVAFLASPEASYVSGHVLVVDGANSVQEGLAGYP